MAAFYHPTVYRSARLQAMRENAENRRRRENSRERSTRLQVMRDSAQNHRVRESSRERTAENRMRMLRTAGEERTPVKGLQGYKLCVIVLRTAGLERAPEKGLQRTA